MSFFAAFLEMLVILFAVAVGFFARRTHILSEDVDQKISKLVMTITLPAMSIGSVLSNENLPSVGEIFSILWVAVIFYGVHIVLALLIAPITRGTREQRGVVRFCLMFSNYGFIGYPVVTALFGQEALLYAIILSLPGNVLCISLAALMLSGEGEFRWQKLFSPATIASMIALVLALLHLKVPAVIGEMLNFVGNITIPLSLLLVGAVLADLPLKGLVSSGRVWFVTIMRLLILPVLLYAILNRTPIMPMVLNVAVVYAALPPPGNGTMYCKEYGGDAGLMAQITFLTTAAASVTIPLVSVWLL